MVTIGMNYKVIKGKEKVFEDAFQNVVTALQDVDGHTKSQIFRDVNDPQQYLIVSQWTKKDAFHAFISSEAFRKTANWGKEEVLSERPQHQIYGGDEPIDTPPGGRRR